MGAASCGGLQVYPTVLQPSTDRALSDFAAGFRLFRTACLRGSGGVSANFETISRPFAGGRSPAATHVSGGFASRSCRTQGGRLRGFDQFYFDATGREGPLGFPAVSLYFFTCSMSPFQKSNGQKAKKSKHAKKSKCSMSLNNTPCQKSNGQFILVSWLP